MAICDICDTSLEFADGYVLATQEVVLNETYWRYMFFSKYSLESMGDSERGAFMEQIVEQMSTDPGGFLVCRRCSHHFTFDRVRARNLAQRGLPAPYSRPVDIIKAAVCAHDGLSKGPLPSRGIGAIDLVREALDNLESAQYDGINLSSKKGSVDSDGMRANEEIVTKKKWWQFWKQT